MDARRRLFALFVALFCAMGWAPTASALGDGDHVVSGESRGVLPGRSPETPPAEPGSGGHDDDSGCLPADAVVLAEARSRAVAPPCARAVRDASRRVGSTGPRGPPSIA